MSITSYLNWEETRWSSEQIYYEWSSYTWHAGVPAAVSLWPVILCMGIFHVLFCHKKVILKAMAFQHCIYACFVCLCVGWKRIYKGRGTGKAIKSLAFTGTVLRTKNLTRLGDAEYLHTQTSLSLSLSSSRGPLLCFLSYSWFCSSPFFCKALCVKNICN